MKSSFYMFHKLLSQLKKNRGQQICKKIAPFHNKYVIVTKNIIKNASNLSQLELICHLVHVLWLLR